MGTMLCRKQHAEIGWDTSKIMILILKLQRSLKYDFDIETKERFKVRFWFWSYKKEEKEVFCEKLETFMWELPPNLPYSTDIALSLTLIFTKEQRELIQSQLSVWNLLNMNVTFSCWSIFHIFWNKIIQSHNLKKSDLVNWTWYS